MHQIIVDHTKAAVGYHLGFDAVPGEFLFDREKEILTSLSPRKKSEWLATREILFRIGGLAHREECVYDAFGKPVLTGSEKHISVSHSGPWAAAMISERSCGLDIQMYSSTVERISKKFLFENEIDQTEMLANRLHHLHLLWGAKESMYKAYGKRKLEFRQHISITDLNIRESKGIGKIAFEDIHLSYEIHFRILPEAVLVFCVQLPSPVMP